ncbi:MAG: ubiquinone/menaquinone biosynthesis methyltransferase, partial [Actinomycetia bacterium]|nr:ubiquinone/menaquinone biosynthesis methyltransferase [Actinomycetes bacterium]
MAKRPADVALMFNDIAERYDLLNTVLSAGQDQLWRRAVVNALDVQPGERVLDLAAGTGTSSAPLAGAGAHVTAVDFSPGMVAIGRESHPEVDFVVADAHDLPFADASFDAATISFGLRNVQRPVDALGEMRRVVRPGGRVVICEFSTPPNLVLRQAYLLWLGRVLPLLSRFGSHPDSYDYLVASILAWPGQ